MSLRLRRMAVCWLCLETGLLFRVGMLHVAKRRSQRRWGGTCQRDESIGVGFVWWRP